MQTFGRVFIVRYLSVLRFLFAMSLLNVHLRFASSLPYAFSTWLENVDMPFLLQPDLSLPTIFVANLAAIPSPL